MRSLLSQSPPFPNRLHKVAIHIIWDQLQLKRIAPT